MKKSFLILLCVLLALSLMFVACSDNNEGENETDTTQHSHTYDDAWSSDQTNHWHAASCEHKSEQSDLAAHVDADGDGVCDVCTYVLCAHTFDKTNWSTDATNHWHASTCGHDVKKDFAAHADADGDGYCDTCKYDLCSNTFEQAWSSNSLAHWHICTCGHGRKSDEAAHTGLDDDGVCDVCGYGAHDHTWSSSYKYDATGHWNTTTCANHAALSGTKADHADADGDFKCDTCGYTMHTHTFSEEWSSNETSHWHIASCGHDVKTEAEAHRDNDRNGLCDVCSYVMCAHTYEDKWSYDEEQHFHKANCDCVNVPNADAEAHDIVEGICSVCGYKDHDHTYASEWSSDENNHWYAATCGCELTRGMTPHSGMDDGICDVCNYGNHEHEWAADDDWSSNESGHWHESTCPSHDPIKKDNGDHVGMNDGICDVCKYGDHDHVWSAWMLDADGHWKVTTCSSHPVLEITKSEHIDSDNDAVCDLCGYQSCTHTFTTAWTSDAMSHWHAASCGHSVKSGLGAHDSNGADGVCSVCGHRNIIGDITSDSSAALVSGGTMEIRDEYTSSNITYTFGDGYTYIKEDEIGSDGEVDATTEYWHYLVGKSSGNVIYSIIKNDYVHGMNSSATLDDLKGYAISMDFLGFGLLDDAYGVEDFLYALYNFAHTNENSNGVVKESYDEAKNEYRLSFQCITGNTMNGTLRQVNVRYSVNANNVIVSLSIECDVYYDVTDPDAESTEGKDYILYPTGAVVILDGAETDAHVTYNITQTVGDRNATPAHDLAEILMTDFTLADADDNAISGKVDIDRGQDLIIKLTGVTPSTANYAFDVPEIKAYLDGAEASNFSYTFEPDTGIITLTLHAVGDWEIDVVTFNTNKTVSVTVLTPETTSLTPIVIEDGWWEEETDEYDVSLGSSVEFKALANLYADGGYTATCADGGTITESTTSNGAYVFTADEAGTYVITMTSTSNPNVTATLTITVTDGSAGKTPADILNGSWQGTYMDMGTGNDHTVIATFEPNFEGALSGYVTVVDKYFSFMEQQELSFTAGYFYTYSEEDGTLTLTYYDGDELNYKFTLNDLGTITLIYINARGFEDEVEMHVLSGGGEGETSLIGDWYEDPESWDEQSVVSIYADNAMIYILETDEMIWCDWEAEDTIIMFYDTETGDPIAMGELMDDGSLVVSIGETGEIELTLYYGGGY